MEFKYFVLPKRKESKDIKKKWIKSRGALQTSVVWLGFIGMGCSSASLQKNHVPLGVMYRVEGGMVSKEAV